MDGWLLRIQGFSDRNGLTPVPFSRSSLTACSVKIEKPFVPGGAKGFIRGATLFGSTSEPSLFRYRIKSNTLGYGNGALPSRPTQLTPFGLQLPGPFSFRFRHRLTPSPTLCAWLETYYSCSQPLGIQLCKDYRDRRSRLSNLCKGTARCALMVAMTDARRDVFMANHVQGNVVGDRPVAHYWVYGLNNRLHENSSLR